MYIKFQSEYFYLMKFSTRLLTIVFLTLSGVASGQHTYKRKNIPLINLEGPYKLKGWHFAPGASYALSRFKNQEETLMQANDTAYKATFDPAGRIGLYLEVGRFHIFKYGYLFNYMDYSLAFKQIRGKEAFNANYEQLSTGTTFGSNDGSGKYGHSYITANFNLNNIYQLNDLQFLQNSIGINADYRVINNNSYSGNLSNQDQQNPSKFLFQLHYKLGYGIKWNDKLFVIPTLETPILSFSTWENGRSRYNMFSSHYRPIYFTIRFAWVSKKSWDCPPVEGHPDDKRKQQQYQQER